MILKVYIPTFFFVQTVLIFWQRKKWKQTALAKYIFIKYESKVGVVTSHSWLWGCGRIKDTRLNVHKGNWCNSRKNSPLKLLERMFTAHNLSDKLKQSLLILVSWFFSSHQKSTVCKVDPDEVTRNPSGFLSVYKELWRILASLLLPLGAPSYLHRACSVKAPLVILVCVCVYEAVLTS